MPGYYANITLDGPSQQEVVAFLTASHEVAYVAQTVKGKTVVFHEDVGAQERLVNHLSAHFRCPALLVMAFGESVLLYELHVNGERADAYVSAPHEGLELDGPTPEGDAARLARTFGIEMDHLVRKVERVLRTPTKPNGEYAYAANRHGELARALGLPLFAVGAGFAGIEIGELPQGEGFDPTKMMKTGSRQ
jgi:hypothetical protein